MTYQELTECFPIGSFWRHTSNPDIHIFHLAGFDCIKGNWFAVETDLSLLPVEILKSSYRICDASVAQPKKPAFIWPEWTKEDEKELQRQDYNAYKRDKYWRNKGVTAC